MDDQQRAREIWEAVLSKASTDDRILSVVIPAITTALRAAPEGFVLAGYCHHLPGDNEAVGLFNKQTKHATIPLYTRPQGVKDAT